MSSRIRTLAAIGAVVLAIACPGVAHADNSNSNSNTNDVTQIGSSSSDFNSSSAGENTVWPPTDLSWPPSSVMNAENGNSGKKTQTPAPTPIVVPSGQEAPAADTGSETPETAPPIVPVDSP
ncbi:MAG TPA: hypothetical protein VFB19_05040 [Mycobacterium sp.]|nr:hypothetical protein [Mycobacterium sp.]